MSHIVFLRNGSKAEVKSTMSQGVCGVFKIFGQTPDRAPQLWQRDGHWREDNTEHPLDIVHVKTYDGHIVALNAHEQ